MVGQRSRFALGDLPSPAWLGALVLFSVTAAGPAAAAVFVVNDAGNASDAAPGDTVCSTAGGVCTLRAAIQEANALAGADTITFTIAGAGVHTISPTVALPLPTITQALTIDGTTQGGYTANGLHPIEIDGTNAGGGAIALDVGLGVSATIVGLGVNRYGTAIRLSGSSSVVRGCYLGTDPTGTVARANGVGIYIRSNANQIDGTTAAGRNVLSGNSVDGMQIDGAGGGTGGSGNVVRGSYIGVAVAGNAALGNANQGISMFNAADNNTIGGVGVGNVISGNSNGIAINSAGSTGNVVQGNFIGTDSTGAVAIGNTARGVTFDQGSASNTIGGTAAGAGNIIAHNGDQGVGMAGAATVGNALLGNAIFDNGRSTGGLGIDLDINWVDINDTGDADGGANDRQNHPVLSAAMTNGTQATLAGSLSSASSTTYRVEFFAGTVAHASGYGEGQRYLGFTTVTTNGSGDAVIAATLTPAVPLAAGQYVAATATVCTDGLPCTTFGDTSEFGGAIQAVNHLVVTTTSDSTSGSNTGSVPLLIANPGADGLISLREAILAVNNNTGADTITFGIPLTDASHYYYRDNGIAGFAPEVTTTLADIATPSSPAISDFDANYPGGLARSWYRIQPGSPYPHVTGPTVIDASNHPLSSTAGPVIEIVGSSAGDTAGFYVDAGASSTWRGLVINRFQREAISSSAASTIIRGNYVGTDVSGTVARGIGTLFAGAGISIAGSNSQVGGTSPADRNVISAGADWGLFVNAQNSVVQGNYIGTDVTGTAALPNARGGIDLYDPATGNIIGGTAPGAGNLISGNTRYGIQLSEGGAVSNNTIQGNHIGTNAAGTAALPNTQDGIFITAGTTGNTVGGTTTQARNVISGNGNYGVRIDTAGTSGNVVAGNHIGTNAAGTAAIPNGSGGIAILSAAAGNTIGGAAAGSGNVISGNATSGVFINGAGTNGNVVAKNRLGTDTTGALDLGNTQYGVLVSGGAQSNVVGAGSPNGNLISGNDVAGVVLTGAGTSNNSVIGNIIGLDLGGTAVLGNTTNGVEIDSGASNNTVGGAGGNGNLISGNGVQGVNIIQAGTTGNRVIGNIIGLDVTGTLARGNVVGVAVGQGATANVVGEPGVGNVISGNSQYGVRLVDAGTSNNRVQGNSIGTDISGTLARGNASDGVRLEAGGAATGNVIGGSVAGYGNLISGNGGSGIQVRDFVSGTLIAGNTIGTNLAGSAALPNLQHGVHLLAGTTNNTIGGTTAPERNLISGNGSAANGQGVRIDGAGTSGNVVLGNFIGSSWAGTVGIPNTAGGIAITSSAANNTIAGNLIAYNANDGVNVAAAGGTGNAILGNSIHSNSGLGIDLGNDGVTWNDLNDADVGPNSRQNFPVLSAAMTNGAGSANFAGSLSAPAGVATYRIELFASAAADPTGFGEGQRYLGFTNVTTNASGYAVIGATLAASLTAGEYVTATATPTVAPFNTSEFSGAIVVYGSLIVTTTSDSTTGSDTSSVAALVANPGTDGRISLREAILATNNTAGADTIRFGIPLTDSGHLYYFDNSAPGLGATTSTPLADSATASSPAITSFDPDYPAGLTRSWYRIQPGAALPPITGAVTLDATTQPGALVGGPVVELYGATAGAGASGLEVTTGPGTVRGLVVDRFDNDGLNLRGPGGFSVTGNYIGTDASGTMGAGNGSSGVFVTQLADAPTTIGGATAAARNVISGNGASPSPEKNGVYVYNYYPPVNSAQVRVQGNYIGTDVTGSVGLGVQLHGIVLEYTGGHLIGGSGAGEGNVVSGNAGPGIDLNGNMDTGAGGGAPTDNNTIEGNRIGTNAAGTAAIPNAGPGIQMYGTVDALSSASGNTIRGNVIAASAGVDAHGIAVWGNADDNLYDANFIGTDSGGTLDLGNAGSGIHVEGWAGFLPTGDRIQNNVIRFNDLDGVRVLGTGASATLTENAISSNDALGIDLAGDGVTLNDALDGDTGPNDLLNFPSFPRPVATAGNLSVTFGLDLPAGWYRVEFFKNPSGADPSGYGEGQAFASSVVVSHPGGGTVPYGHSFPGSAGDVVSATTTACTDGAACTTLGSTSEFSLAWAAVPTAVGLMSFTATGADRAVDLAWQTGSELDNLGFHLYRSLSSSGPWTRLNSALIPGLGSSPLGASYSWHDGGLVNRTRYYYRLEDVDAASVSTFHGPVTAVPSAPDEDGGDDGGADGTERDGSCPAWVLAAAPDVVSPICTRFGDPESVSLQILSRDVSSATVELHTGGFWALRDAAGEVRVFVRGLEFPADPRAPALPRRRALVEAVVGKGVELVSAEALDLRSFPGLRPSAVGLPEMAVGEDGTVRAGRRAVGAPAASRGYLPREVARLAGTVFQRERKSAVVEITPVRFAGSGLALARTVRVRLAFTGTAEEIGAGRRGRSLPRRRGESRDVLARLHTARRGVHAVSFEQLFPQRGRRLPTARLRLQRQGEAVAFHVEPEASVFGPGSRLYFFADRTALSTDYSPEVAYELARSPGVQMGVVSGAPLGEPVAAPSTGSASFETNRIYQPGLLEAEDVWLWEAVGSGVTRTEAFTLSGVDTSSGEGARLVVQLQGASESGLVTDHHLRVLLNGTEVGEATFAGKRPDRVELPVPASVLKEGDNEVEVTNAGDTGVTSLVFLDRFEVTYPQVPTAPAGVFEGVWGTSGPVEISGVSGVPVVLSLPVAATGVPGDEAVRWMSGLRTAPGSVRFQAEAGRRYLVVSPEALLSPRIESVAASALRDATNQADYLVIAPRAFVEAAQPLLERRRGQGLSARAAAFEEIASEFGHGQPSAEAIRQFLSYAYHSWRAPAPRYVLLLGDSTADPRHFVASSGPSPLPALWTKSTYMWTVSDPALGAVNGEDLVPDLAIGRLPATTVEEAEKLVAKVLSWEESGQDLGGPAVLVADDPDRGGDFEADVEDIRASYLAGRPTTVLKVSELGAGTRGAILSAFDDGASLMSYVGHGGTAVWASENVLNDGDVPSLRAQSRQPLLLTMNCLNGYFVAPNLDALAEALLKAEGRGVVGAFSPSGLSLDGPAHEYHRAVMAELASGRHARLGDAILAAQRSYAETGLMPELLDVYHLLGDPTMKIK